MPRISRKQDRSSVVSSGRTQVPESPSLALFVDREEWAAHVTLAVLIHAVNRQLEATGSVPIGRIRSEKADRVAAGSDPATISERASGQQQAINLALSSPTRSGGG